MSSPRIVGAIQARSASGRLPRKAFASLGGVPIVLRMVERLRTAQSLDEIVLATTTDASDDELTTLFMERGILVHRGPVDDIVARLLGAARATHADALVRVWGDSPFIDGGIIDSGVAAVLDEGFDFVTTGVPGNTSFATGSDFEVYRVGTLEKLMRAADDPFFREFPFEFILGGHEGLTWRILQGPQDDSDLHLTIDYPEDLERANRIYDALHREDRPFTYSEVVAYCRAHPEIAHAAPTLARNPDYYAKKGQRTS